MDDDRRHFDPRVEKAPHITDDQRAADERRGPPGFTWERWTLYLKERRWAAGQSVEFTPAEVEELHREARLINDSLTAEEAQAMFSPPPLEDEDDG